MSITAPGMIRSSRERLTEAEPSIPSVPHNITSKNCAGMVTSGFLVEAERVDLDELRRQYPEAFNRPYDKASGLELRKSTRKRR